MVDRDQLRDHAAHRGAGDIGALRAERVYEFDGVAGHVVEGVGNLRPPPRHDLRHQRARVRRRQIGEMGRLADVAIIEPDDAKPIGRQPLAERVRPENELGGEAHDEQDERVAHASEALIFDVDSLGSNLRHGQSLEQVYPAKSSPAAFSIDALM